MLSIPLSERVERANESISTPRMREILIRARIGNGQIRVQSVADGRPDRVVWPNRLSEWAGLRPENGTFDTPYYADTYARQKWFYQAQGESPARFRRTPGAGSLYWLNTRECLDRYLDGSQPDTLTVPQPVPAKLSGQSPSTTPRLAARSGPTRTTPPCGRCLSWPASPIGNRDSPLRSGACGRGRPSLDHGHPRQGMVRVHP